LKWELDFAHDLGFFSDDQLRRLLELTEYHVSRKIEPIISYELA